MEIVTEVCIVWSPQWEKSFDYGAARTFFHELETFLARIGDRYNTQQLEEAQWRIPIGDQEFDPFGMAKRATHIFSVGYENLKSYAALEVLNLPLTGT